MDQWMLYPKKVLKGVWVMQIMDMRDNEISQLATFLGHTETHKEFYRLPKDVLMIAKVSKVLLKLVKEKEKLSDCKNKKMEDIEVKLQEPELSSCSSEDDDSSNSSQKFTMTVPYSGMLYKLDSIYF